MDEFTFGFKHLRDVRGRKIKGSYNTLAALQRRAVGFGENPILMGNVQRMRQEMFGRLRMLSEVGPLSITKALDPLASGVFPPEISPRTISGEVAPYVSGIPEISGAENVLKRISEIESTDPVAGLYSKLGKFKGGFGAERAARKIIGAVHGVSPSAEVSLVDDAILRIARGESVYDIPLQLRGGLVRTAKGAIFSPKGLGYIRGDKSQVLRYNDFLAQRLARAFAISDRRPKAVRDQLALVRERLVYARTEARPSEAIGNVSDIRHMLSFSFGPLERQRVIDPGMGMASTRIWENAPFTRMGVPNVAYLQEYAGKILQRSAITGMSPFMVKPEGIMQGALSMLDPSIFPFGSLSDLTRPKHWMLMRGQLVEGAVGIARNIARRAGTRGLAAGRMQTPYLTTSLMSELGALNPSWRHGLREIQGLVGFATPEMAPMFGAELQGAVISKSAAAAMRAIREGGRTERIRVGSTIGALGAKFSVAAIVPDEQIAGLSMILSTNPMKEPFSAYQSAVSMIMEDVQSRMASGRMTQSEGLAALNKIASAIGGRLLTEGIDPAPQIQGIKAPVSIEMPSVFMEHDVAAREYRAAIPRLQSVIEEFGLETNPLKAFGIKRGTKILGTKLRSTMATTIAEIFPRGSSAMQQSSIASVSGLIENLLHPRGTMISPVKLSMLRLAGAGQLASYLGNIGKAFGASVRSHELLRPLASLAGIATDLTPTDIGVLRNLRPLGSGNIKGLTGGTIFDPRLFSEGPILKFAEDIPFLLEPMKKLEGSVLSSNVGAVRTLQLPAPSLFQEQLAAEEVYAGPMGRAMQDVITAHKRTGYGRHAYTPEQKLMLSRSVERFVREYEKFASGKKGLLRKFTHSRVAMSANLTVSPAPAHPKVFEALAKEYGLATPEGKAAKKIAQSLRRFIATSKVSPLQAGTFAVSPETIMAMSTAGDAMAHFGMSKADVAYAVLSREPIISQHGIFVGKIVLDPTIPKGVIRAGLSVYRGIGADFDGDQLAMMLLQGRYGQSLGKRAWLGQGMPEGYREIAKNVEMSEARRMVEAAMGAGGALDEDVAKMFSSGSYKEMLEAIMARYEDPSKIIRDPQQALSMLLAPKVFSPLTHTFALRNRQMFIEPLVSSGAMTLSEAQATTTALGLAHQVSGIQKAGALQTGPLETMAEIYSRLRPGMSASEFAESKENIQLLERLSQNLLSLSEQSADVGMSAFDVEQAHAGILKLSSSMRLIERDLGMDANPMNVLTGEPKSINEMAKYLGGRDWRGKRHTFAPETRAFLQSAEESIGLGLEEMTGLGGAGTPENISIINQIYKGEAASKVDRIKITQTAAESAASVIKKGWSGLNYPSKAGIIALGGLLSFGAARNLFFGGGSIRPSEPPPPPPTTAMERASSISAMNPEARMLVKPPVRVATPAHRTYNSDVEIDGSIDPVYLQGLMAQANANSGRIGQITINDDTMRMSRVEMYPELERHERSRFY